MSLALLGTGMPATISGLSGTTKLRKYLTELGFVSGEKVEVLQHSYGNNIIVALGGAKMTMGRKIAHHVHITLGKEKEICQRTQLQQKS
jgi:Fe2+ transport system protein FeoA